ncbi:unnamed protein product [Clonostachys rosea f. rosea IK726]|uniref:Uncharacterized protein n=2 Tax=Clonostachys rosea f. rosea IK726 TaxID=1349383 RepID=A0ACA9UMC0_BIOOC|nr:unnamed protein product [Clonostachys rosea f. rosea IK726]CAG9953512.1 unnamed protein product [Clonostachys rosea f. rosea IK726]
MALILRPASTGNVGAAFAGARRDLEDLEERDFDELYELVTRSPKNGVKAGFAHHALSGTGKVGAAFAGARRDLEDEDLVARALEELDERDFWIFTPATLTTPRTLNTRESFCETCTSLEQSNPTFGNRGF